MRNDRDSWLSQPCTQLRASWERAAGCGVRVLCSAQGRVGQHPQPPAPNLCHSLAQGIPPDGVVVPDGGSTPHAAASNKVRSDSQQPVRACKRGLTQYIYNTICGFRRCAARVSLMTLCQHSSSLVPTPGVWVPGCAHHSGMSGHALVTPERPQATRTTHMIHGGWAACPKTNSATRRAHVCERHPGPGRPVALTLTCLNRSRLCDVVARRRCRSSRADRRQGHGDEHLCRAGVGQDPEMVGGGLRRPLQAQLDGRHPWGVGV